MVVLKAGEHSCRMTHANFWKGKRKSFGIIFQPNALVSSCAYGSGGTEMSLNLDAVEGKISLSSLVSSCAYGRCFFAAKGTTDLHTGVGPCCLPNSTR